MNLVYEYDSGAIGGIVYYYGINRTHSSEGEFYQYNGHGDVVQLTNSLGIIVRHYEYDAFGNEVEPSASDTNPFRYCGEYFDAESGTIYLRARYYDPAIGRFTQQDAWEFANPGDPLSLNLYIYCYSNPVFYIDPSGNIAWKGEIHDVVKNRIAIQYNMYTEQKIDYELIGYGRADLLYYDKINNIAFIWDVKPNNTRQINKGISQIDKYIKNKWHNHENVKLNVGKKMVDPYNYPNIEIERDSFYYKSEYYTYKINYQYYDHGIITYDYEEVDFDWKELGEDMEQIGRGLIEIALSLLTKIPIKIPVY